MQRFADFADDTRKAAEKNKGKAYRFKELPNGTLVPRDSAYPLDAPKVVEKARAKVEKATKEAKK